MHPRQALLTCGRGLHRAAVRPNVLFGGVYGAVLASSMVAALAQHDESSRSDRLYDAEWLLITVIASALAHGYAGLVVARAAGTERPKHGLLRAIGSEWPLVASSLPTFVMLLGAGLGWWGSHGIEGVVLLFNVVLLFFWGLVSARAAGRKWPRSVLLGLGDALIGFVVVVANAIIK